MFFFVFGFLLLSPPQKLSALAQQRGVVSQVGCRFFSFEHTRHANDTFRRCDSVATYLFRLAILQLHCGLP